MKRLLFCLIFVFLLSCLSGCKKVGSESSKNSINSETPQKTDNEMYYYDPVAGSPLSFRQYLTTITTDDSNSERIQFVSRREIEFDKYDEQNIEFLNGKTIISFDYIQNKFIVKFYPDPCNSTAEIGIFDPAVNEYKKIEEIPFSASYGKDSFVINDRYYVMLSSYESDVSLTGCVRVYDIETDELSVIDEFEEYNIVQFATSISDNEFVYMYYEDNTQDWVMKYYDLISHESAEIFRHSNYNKTETLSPMALSYDGENIVLVLQYIEKEMYKTNYYTEKEVYKTNFMYLNMQGELVKTEVTDLNVFFGDYYEITDLLISDNYYFLNAIYTDESNELTDKKSIILKKSDNEFVHIDTTLAKKYNLISNTLLNKENIFYEAHETSRNDMNWIINVNLNNNSARSYEYPFDVYGEADEVELTRMLSEDDIFVLLYDKEKNYKYKIIDFKNAAKLPYGYDIRCEETSE